MSDLFTGLSEAVDDSKVKDLEAKVKKITGDVVKTFKTHTDMPKMPKIPNVIIKFIILTMMMQWVYLVILQILLKTVKQNIVQIFYNDYILSNNTPIIIKIMVYVYRE